MQGLLLDLVVSAATGATEESRKLFCATILMVLAGRIKVSCLPTVTLEINRVNDGSSWVCYQEYRVSDA